MKKRALAWVLLSLVLATLLAFPVYAYYSVYASGSSASAYYNTGDSSITGYIELYATIGYSNFVNWDRDEYDGTCYYAYAHVSCREGGNPQSARARIWFNGDHVDSAYWSVF